MTKQEIFKYFKEKNLFVYFKALVNIEIFFVKELNVKEYTHAIGFDEYHTTLESLIRDKDDLKKIEKEIHRIFDKKEIKASGIRSWFIMPHYKAYTKDTSLYRAW
jgi:hypothetical protein